MIYTGGSNGQDSLTQRMQQGMILAMNHKPDSFMPSSRELVEQWGHCQLFKYSLGQNRVTPRPSILIVYALVNRPYILDLQAGHSSIERLLKEGLDVYLLDWGYPDSSESDRNLDGYINGLIDKAVDRVRFEEASERINIMGVCQGGVLSLCYASLHPEKVAKLITMVTPVDFHTPDNLLTHWVKPLDVDLMVESMGNIPGHMLTTMFQAIQPAKLLLTKYLDFVDQLSVQDGSSKPEAMAMFLAMERWINDSPDLVGGAFKEFVKGCFQENRLVKGDFCIGDKPVRLDKLSMPVFNVFAKHDHLVPPASSKALASLIPKDNYKEMEVATGHIGMFVSNKALKIVPSEIVQWLKDETS